MTLQSDQPRDIFLANTPGIEAFSLYLPPRCLCRENCHYGAPYIASEYCNLIHEDSIPTIRGEWCHGWHPIEHNVHPELVVGTTGNSRDSKNTTIFWVARDDQVAYLREHGYKRAEAIGMPLIYLQRPTLARIKGSLLVMPVHSLETTKHDWDFDKYANEIQAIRHNFSMVVVCIHPDCIKNGYWLNAFNNKGFTVISGAYPQDRNSLLRMAILFSRFEFVTTNGFGSHLVYSSYFGAKTSIYGTNPRYSNKDFNNNAFSENCPELIPIIVDLLSESKLRDRYEYFYTNPWSASEKQRWAEFQVGLKHKQSPHDLERIFFNRKIRLKRFIKSVISLQR